MNENGKKKREWVKTAAIVFLSVMLVLTFFSNTIMNYSLPEVATQYVQSGTITAKIRGSGTVESGDPYNVEVKESRKVAGVAVKVGDVVEKGAVLMYLEDTESDELKAAKEVLEKAQKEYDTALLSAELTSSDIQAANGGMSVETFRQQITAAQNAVTAAEREAEAAQRTVNDIQQRYDAFTTQIAITTANNSEAYNNANNALKEAQIRKDNAQNAYDSLQKEVNLLKERIKLLTPTPTPTPEPTDGTDASGQDTRENDAEDPDAASGALPTADEGMPVPQTDAELAELEAQLQAKQTELINAQTNLNQAEMDVTQLKQVFDREAQAVKDSIANLEAQQSYVNKELTDAKNVLTQKQALLTEKQENLTELSSRIGRVSGLETYLENIQKAQELVDELTAKSVDATITAPISGTVTALNVTAGKTIDVGTPVAVMQPEGKGYTLSFSVTNEQARRLSVGDVADLVNAWRYDDLTVTLASIKPDPTDPGQKKELTFDVSGSVTAGQTLNLSVGQKSANYDYIVPNSAIREDNNGKFILIVESKAGPLGTRYMASRVDVEVLASDDTQSAISAALYGNEFVITTSTKPVEAGKQVRLSDNS